MLSSEILQELETAEMELSSLLTAAGSGVKLNAQDILATLLTAIKSVSKASGLIQGQKMIDEMISPQNSPRPDQWRCFKGVKPHCSPDDRDAHLPGWGCGYYVQ